MLTQHAELDHRYDSINIHGACISAHSDQDQYPPPPYPSPPSNKPVISLYPWQSTPAPTNAQTSYPACLLRSHVIAASGSRGGGKVVVLRGVEGHLGGGIGVGEDGPQVHAAGHVHICLLSVLLDASN